MPRTDTPTPADFETAYREALSLTDPLEVIRGVVTVYVPDPSCFLTDEEQADGFARYASRLSAFNRRGGYEVAIDRAGTYRERWLAWLIADRLPGLVGLAIPRRDTLEETRKDLEAAAEAHYITVRRAEAERVRAVGGDHREEAPGDTSGILREIREIRDAVTANKSGDGRGANTPKGRRPDTKSKRAVREACLCICHAHRFDGKHAVDTAHKAYKEIQAVAQDCGVGVPSASTLSRAFRLGFRDTPGVHYKAACASTDPADLDRALLKIHEEASRLHQSVFLGATKNIDGYEDILSTE